MPLQIIAPLPVTCTPSSLSLNHKGSSRRAFIKLAATALFRHGCHSDVKDPNLQVLACMLPEEVMHQIFFACARLSVHENPERSWSWVNVSYVCSSWRRIALQCQDLWRYIDFSNPKWHAVTFGRAKTCPLHIQTTITDRNIRLLHRTLQLAHQIEDIHLTAPIQHIYSLLPVLSHPNPALQSLIIDVRIPRDRSALEVYDPPSFPTGGPPLHNLKHMELHSAPFYLLTPRCTYLTHFHLHDLPLTERPTLRYFLFMLEKLERLQYLTLDRAFPINIDFDDIRTLERRVSLPQLRTITLGGSVTEIANLLDSITIAPSVCIISKVYTLSDLKSNIWRLAQQFNAHSWAGVDRLSPLETLVITRKESCSRFTGGFQPNPKFRQSLRFRAFREDSERGEAAFDVTFDADEHNSNDDVMIVALAATWKALALSRIHTLALQNLDIVTQRTWLEFLKTLPGLRILDITGSPPSGLVWALLLNARYHHHQLSDRDAHQRSHRLLVPKLKDIYLHKVDCSSGGFMVAPTALVNSHLDLDDSRFLDVLVVSLTARRCFGLALRSLSISRCEYVLNQSVDDARKAVCHLICDLRNGRKEKIVVDEYSPARYWEGGDLKNYHPRHFHRLRTLVQLESEPE
ncbi:hypothetical protein BYT27DRAFT_7146440 [Phlegmacium glaucopus]|nr:hypothetical protein BYT27DRAFT_7146440 [Phlegmacium glaucopus]